MEQVRENARRPAVTGGCVRALVIISWVPKGCSVQWWYVSPRGCAACGLRSLAGRGWIERLAAFGHGLPKRAEIGAGERLGQQYRVFQQGLGRRESLRRRARRHRLQTVGEAVGNRREPA